MIDYGIVRGSAESAIPLIVNVDTVYVHTNIKKIQVEQHDGTFRDEYEYNEVQYGKDEYIKLMSEQNQAITNQLVSTQLALTEIYESVINGGI